MNKPLTIWKGGRPRKTGPREPSGRPARGAPVLPPAMQADGLALAATDYRPHEVTERGQVIGRTVARRDWRDMLPIGNGRHQIDGDELRALAEYAARHAKCEVKVKCHLDRTPGSGDGLAGIVDQLRVSIRQRNVLRMAMPGVMWQHCEAVFDDQAMPNVARLKEAAVLVMAALIRERRQA